MCFRPPDVSQGPLICPECGKKIVSPNFTPVKCPFCNAPLPASAAVPDSQGPKVPGPSAPTPPDGPSAPKVPGAPRSPKPPVG